MNLIAVHYKTKTLTTKRVITYKRSSRRLIEKHLSSTSVLPPQYPHQVKAFSCSSFSPQGLLEEEKKKKKRERETTKLGSAKGGECECCVSLLASASLLKQQAQGGSAKGSSSPCRIMQFLPKLHFNPNNFHLMQVWPKRTIPSTLIPLLSQLKSHFAYGCVTHWVHIIQQQVVALKVPNGTLSIKDLIGIPFQFPN